MAEPAAANAARPALIAGVACYTIWGLLPLLYMLSASLGVGAAEMTAHRALWAVLWAGALVLLARQGGQVMRVLRTPRILALLALTGVLIGINWLVYVWAISNGRTLEGALGYYINPLMNVAAGALFFRERVDRWSLAAIALAAIGVVIQTAALGHLPWISLALAGLFCAYGILRKRVDADAQTGLFVECLILTLPGLAWVLWLESTGGGHFRQGADFAAVLLVNGPATVAPLALFAWAARRLPLSTVGFLQYIGPTLTFFIGLAAGEAFTPLRALSFAFIWAGVAVFALGAWKRTRHLAVPVRV
jgi:chloramphenicol-sensitive protein RarD